MTELEKGNKINTSLLAIQGISTDNAGQSSVNKDHTESCLTETKSDNCEPTQKVLVKPREDAALFSDTKKLPAESKLSEKSVEKQVEATTNQPGLHLLKWKNNPATQAKGKKKKV